MFTYQLSWIGYLRLAGQMQQNQCLINVFANIDFNQAENEPRKVCCTIEAQPGFDLGHFGIRSVPVRIAAAGRTDVGKGHQPPGRARSAACSERNNALSLGSKRRPDYILSSTEFHTCRYNDASAV